jgi:hypothetical protein
MDYTAPFLWRVRARAEALGGLAEHLSESQKVEAFSAFLGVADQLSRPRLLKRLKPFISLIAKIGGEHALLQVRNAMRDTAIWYPWRFAR